MFKTQKKVPVYAGLPQKKIKKVGYEIIEFTYDSAEKDCLISEKVIKRVIK